MRWLPSTCPSFGPDHVRPESLSHPPPRGIRGGHERRCKGEPPRCRLALESTPAPAVADEVPDLVQCDEVADLPSDGWDPDLEASLAAPVAMPHGDHDGPSSPVDAGDAVLDAEVVDVTVERFGPHRASVVGAMEVTVTQSGGANFLRLS